MSNPAEPGEAGEKSNPVHLQPAQILGTFSRARPMTVGQAAGSAVTGTVVKVVGKAAPGPDGPLRAPLSGVECVWYRSIVSRSVRGSIEYADASPQLQPMNPLAHSDLPDYGATGRVNMRGERFGSDTSSSAPFLLTDGAATVRIDPHTSDIDCDIFGINEVVVVDTKHHPSIAGQEFGTGTFGPDELHSEWVIPVGADVLAVGTVHQAGAGATALVPQGEDIVLVSTKPEQQILSRNNAAVGGAHLPLTSARGIYMVLAAVLVVAAVIAVLVIFVV